MCIQFSSYGETSSKDYAKSQLPSMPSRVVLLFLCLILWAGTCVHSSTPQTSTFHRSFFELITSSTARTPIRISNCRFYSLVWLAYNAAIRKGNKSGLLQLPRVFLIACAAPSLFLCCLYYIACINSCQLFF